MEVVIAPFCYLGYGRAGRDLPAPVSPEMAVKPGRKSCSRAGTMAKFRMCRCSSMILDSGSFAQRPACAPNFYFSLLISDCIMKLSNQCRYDMTIYRMIKMLL